MCSNALDRHRYLARQMRQVRADGAGQGRGRVRRVKRLALEAHSARDAGLVRLALPVRRLEVAVEGDVLRDGVPEQRRVVTALEGVVGAAAVEAVGFWAVVVGGRGEGAGVADG